MELDIGYKIGSYRIVEKTGEGGMGTVYRAHHKITGKAVAVKVLRPHLCENELVMRRFFNEARAASRVDDPGIVSILDVAKFTYKRTPSAYIMMEFLAGDTLEKRIQTRGRLSVKSTVTIGRQIASALEAAHGKNIIHRDLKPDNVMLVRDPAVPGGERAKLLDFGVAKLSEKDGSANLTQSGAMVGTPLYMAPEQCRGARDIDGRADLYALGCMLFEMLCGRPLFDGKSPAEVMMSHCSAPPPEPSSIVGEIPRSLESLILSLLKKEPHERFCSARDVSCALAVIASDPVPARVVAEPSDRTTVRFHKEHMLAGASSLLKQPEPVQPEPIQLEPVDDAAPSTVKMAVSMTSSPPVDASAVPAGVRDEATARNLAASDDESTLIELSRPIELPDDCQEADPLPPPPEVISTRTPADLSRELGLDTALESPRITDTAEHDERRSGAPGDRARRPSIRRARSHRGSGG